MKMNGHLPSAPATLPAKARIPFARSNPIEPHNGYPTSDGKPMAETDWHRDLMSDLIQTLKTRFAKSPKVYVSGNLLVFYEPGNKRRHLAPDVFVVKGVDKTPRPNYLAWEEGKGPDVVIELTSSSTKSEDTSKKKQLYRDVLCVSEYFLFDPFGDYLKPPMQGFRLENGQYTPIVAIEDRLPSAVLNLHLERRGKELRLYDPVKRRILPTPFEVAQGAPALASKLKKSAQALQAAESENERLRRENEALRRAPE